jgi:hypothetical protein
VQTVLAGGKHPLNSAFLGSAQSLHC